jgi:hypothetical protein
MLGGEGLMKRYGALRRAIPAALIALLIGHTLWRTLGRKIPHPFEETTVWSLVLVTAFVGWGSLLRVIVARNERVDLGLRAIWGAALLAFLGGLLLVPSWMNQDAAILMVDVGAGLAIATTIYERAAIARRVDVAWRCARREPRLLLAVAAVVALLALHYLAGIAEWHTDPYDDDIAYLTFVKKLLQTGSFPEPFSFRRLSALGGQTFFLALTAIRAEPHQGHTFDRSVCMLLIALLIVGHRSRGRRPSLLFMIGALLLVPTLPLVTRNMASHYSAMAFFLALFRSMTWAGERSRAPWKSALPIALVTMVVCTLRQNYMPIAVVFLAFCYGAHAIRPGSLKERFAEPLLVALFTGVALVPWFVAAWQSNRTFLFPLVPGTYNAALRLGSDTVTKAEEVRVFLRTLIDGVPVYTLGLFFLAAIFARETDRRKPLIGFVIASGVGYVVLVHAINQGDTFNLGRYASGFFVAVALVTALTTGTARFRNRPTRMHVAAAITLLALLLQVGRAIDGSSRFYARVATNIDAALREIPRHAYPLEKSTAALSKSLQESVPEGARLAVMLDEPHLLNFKRNPIWNLDMPGYSSLAPGMPFFLGSMKLEAYFRQIGVRYIAFVRPDRSTYHYRRDYWMQLLVDEMEIWRTFAPYVIDIGDNLVDIASRHRRLFEQEGVVVLDLEAPPQ